MNEHDASINLRYGDMVEDAVRITFSQQPEDTGLNVRVEIVNPVARPLAMMQMYAIALSAVLGHYSSQGVYSPVSDLARVLDIAITQTMEAIEVEVELERVIDSVGTLPITADDIDRLFSGQL